VIEGVNGAIHFDNTLLSKHVLFLGVVGSGKISTMNQLVRNLRSKATPGDVFVAFGSEDLYLEQYEVGDAVITNNPQDTAGRVSWNLFRELQHEEGEREGYIQEGNWIGLSGRAPA
jgi:GTPase SAR1 family protein